MTSQTGTITIEPRTMFGTAHETPRSRSSSTFSGVMPISIRMSAAVTSSADNPAPVISDTKIIFNVAEARRSKLAPLRQIHVRVPLPRAWSDRSIAPMVAEAYSDSRVLKNCSNLRPDVHSIGMVRMMGETKGASQEPPTKKEAGACLGAADSLDEIRPESASPCPT